MMLTVALVQCVVKFQLQLELDPQSCCCMGDVKGLVSTLEHADTWYPTKAYVPKLACWYTNTGRNQRKSLLPCSPFLINASIAILK